jgi:hypothetical protein
MEEAKLVGSNDMEVEMASFVDGTAKRLVDRCESALTS